MRQSPPENSCVSMHPMASAWRRGPDSTWWRQHREASLNWLALGLLLAAWNASDNDVPMEAREVPMEARTRPESLRGYSCVSVRATRARADLVREVTKASTYCKAQYL